MHFDPTISVGNLLTIVVFGGAAIRMWYRQTQAIDLIRQSQQSIEQTQKSIVAALGSQDLRIAKIEIAAEVDTRVEAILEKLRREKSTT